MVKFAVFSTPYQQENECLVVNRLLAAGLDRFHVRKPGWTKLQYEHFIEQIDRSFTDRLILHDQIKLCKVHNLGGFHFGKRMRNNNLGMALKLQWVKLWHPQLQLSTTVTSPEELKKLCSDYDSLYLSPVFGTGSSESAYRSWSHKTLSAHISQCHKPVYALGGIDAHNAVRAVDFGFDGLAVISAIWKSRDPVSEFRKIQSNSRHAELI